MWIVCRQSINIMATTLTKLCPLASDCTEIRGLQVAQALLQLTAKLAQQLNLLVFCEYVLASSYCTLHCCVSVLVYFGFCTFVIVCATLAYIYTYIYIYIYLSA